MEGSFIRKAVPPARMGLGGILFVMKFAVDKLLWILKKIQIYAAASKVAS